MNGNRIQDHGHDDPIPYVLDDVDQAIARIAREAMEEQRQQRNADDAKRVRVIA